MKTIRLLVLVACCVMAGSASAHGQFKLQRARAVYQYVRPAPVYTGYVVPAPCPYPYGCDVNGYPYPPPTQLYMDPQSGASMLAAFASLVLNLGN